MPGFVPDMRFMRGENFDILADEHAFAITFRGRVVYRTESPIIIRVALLTGRAGHRIYDMLHRADQLVDQVAHDTSQEEVQEELQPQAQPQAQPQPQQPARTATILDQTKRINRLILRFTLACIYITILVLRQIMLLVALVARVSGTAIDAPRPRPGRGRQQQKQQQQEGQRRPRSESDEAYQRSLRIAKSARECQAVVDAAAALIRPVPFPISRGRGQFEDGAQPGVAARRVDRRVSVEEVPDMEGTESQGLTTGRDQPGQADAEQRPLRAGRRGETTDDDEC